MLEKLISQFPKFERFAVSKAPALLAGAAITGVISTVAFAISATPKAIDEIRAKEIEKGDFLTKKEKFNASAKYYIPTAISATLTITAIIGSTCISQRRIAGFAGAYVLSEKALKRYEDKIIEYFGEDTHKKIKKEICQERIREDCKTESVPVLLPNDSEFLWYDEMSGRYFKSTKNKIEQAKNNLNAQLMNMEVISLNDYYYEIGNGYLDATYIGDALGYHFSEDGLLDFSIDGSLDANGTPCGSVHVIQTPMPIHSY